jgi:threonine dehydrogenase-like Zn-dependent dehydrogenase
VTNSIWLPVIGSYTALGLGVIGLCFYAVAKGYKTEPKTAAAPKKDRSAAAEHVLEPVRDRSAAR